MKTASLKSVEDVLKTVHESTTAEFSELKSVLEKQISTSQESINQKLQADYEKAQFEIAEYKRQKIQEVNKEIDILVGRVAQEVLGKAIPLADHEQLILTAL